MRVMPAADEAEVAARSAVARVEWAEAVVEAGSVREVMVVVVEEEALATAATAAATTAAAAAAGAAVTAVKATVAG